MQLPESPKLPFLLQTLKIIAQPTQFLETCAQNYGETFTLRVLGGNSPPVVFFSNPNSIERIFTTASEKFELGKITHVFKPLTGPQSLIMQDGQRHQRLRQLLMPPLHGKRLPTYSQLIGDITEAAIAGWQPGQTLAIRSFMSDISLQVILQVVFGLHRGPRYDLLKHLIEPFLEWVTSPMNSIQFFWPLLQQNLGVWSPWGYFLRQQRQIDRLIELEIAERRQNPGGEDILSLLISAQDEAGQFLTNDELRDQLMTVLLLGHETTASALAWAFYWVHRDPKIQNQLIEELDGVAVDEDPVKLTQLPYLTAVCQEALRIYPIALIAQPRVVREAVTLEDYEFNPGTILVPCIHLAHRRPDVYPEPEEFKPERFLNRKFSPYEYFPFGGGSRSCIGMALSLFEMKLILATVLRRYRLLLKDNGSVRPVRRGITIVPSGNFRLQVVN